MLFFAGGCERKLAKSPQPAEQTQLLHKAAADGDIEQVKLLLSKGADVNAKDEKEKTPLNHAAQAGKMEIVQLLIKAGANLNSKDKDGKSPAILARASWHTDVVELLVSKGADVTLDLVAYLGDLAGVKNFMESYSDVNESQLNQALISALDVFNNEHRDVAEFLLDKGANPNARDKNDATALHSWAWGGDPVKAKSLIEFLLSKGADVNARQGEIRWTPLHSACARGRGSVAKVLVDNDADVNAKDEHGRTPLYLAAESNQKDIVELLLAQGAKVDEKDDEYGFTALHYAARFGNKNVAELLIDKGADVNAKDKEGHTLLYIAVNHDYKVAELLIDKGADVNIKTESGQTLFELAEERKSIESAFPDMIFDGEPNSAFGTGIACGDIDGDGYDDILIGALRYDNQKGRAYLFYGGPDVDTTCDLIFEGESEGDLFGGPVSCGDVDNDGYDDIVIGAPYYNNKRGRAYLYWGSNRNSMDSNPNKIFDGEAEEGARFSFGLGPVIYDIDNDGYRDIIFGAIAIEYPHEFINKAYGKAYLYYGNAKELMDTSYDLIFIAENADDRFGVGLDCGDVDNDGYGDIIIGACFYPSRKPCQGRAYLYYGDSKSNIDAEADMIFDAESKYRHFFGQGIICIDQNKDGFDDILIGAQGYEDCQGRVYLFYGDTRENLDIAPDKTFDGEIPDSDYGFHLVCGNIDGDNQADIVIGADRIRKSVGRVYVYWGSELSGLSPKPSRIFTGENPREWFSNLTACGDVNNDGYDDLIIGAYGYKAGSEQGRAYLYYGGPRKNR